MQFFQTTTAHCELDALAHIRRDNFDAESIKLVSKQDMEFASLTMYRFEVLMPERQWAWELGTPYDETPMSYFTA